MVVWEKDVKHKLKLHPSRLKNLIGQDWIEVPSAHHQGVAVNGADLITAGRTEDGVIEAVERPDYPFLMAVQWHPERYYNKDSINRVIMLEFIKACCDHQAEKNG